MFKNDPDHPVVNIQVQNTSLKGNSSAEAKTGADYYMQAGIYDSAKATRSSKATN